MNNTATSLTDVELYEDDRSDPTTAGRSLEQERTARKRALVAAFRLFARLGYDEGVAGHITARDPERLDHFWVNPFGLHFSRIRVDDLLLLNARGKVVEGTGRASTPAFAIHSAVHEARPDVVAVAHAHTIHGRAFASLDQTLDPIVQESCAFWRNHVLFREYKGLILERDEGDALARTMGDARAAILRHHGLLTTGPSVEAAAWWFITMDRACQMQLLAQAAGKPRLMSEEEAVLAARQFGNNNKAALSFRMIAEVVLEEEPDALEPR